MATAEYWRWVASGKNFQLAKPIAEMVALARRYGIGVLGTIGNEEHQQTDYPEDHLPYSYTAWPVPAPGWVCACDLENVRNLGPAILRDARAGKTPWLKYMNFDNRHYEHSDGFRSGTYSGDGHVHLSCRSDWLTRSIGSYDPLQEDDLFTDADRALLVTAASVNLEDRSIIARTMHGTGALINMVPVQEGDWKGARNHLAEQVKAMQAQLTALRAEHVSDRQRDELLMAALKAGGGSADVVAIVTAVQAAKEELKARADTQHAEAMAALRKEADATIAGLEAELSKLRV